MSKAQQKQLDYVEVPVKKPYKGWFPDLLRSEIPAGGFTTLTNFGVLDQQIQKRGMYANFGGATQLDNPATLAYYWANSSTTLIQSLVLGTKTNLFYTQAPAGGVTKINNPYSAGNPYSMGNNKRWQVASLGDNIFLVVDANIFIMINTSFLASKVHDIASDSQTPTAPTFILNCANHLVVNSPQESLCRVRWSDINNPGVWTPSPTVEAGFIDVDEGAITAMGNLGPQQFLVYTDHSIYIYTYVGYPLYFSKFRVVDDIGCASPYSLVTKNDIHYFLGRDGFYSYNGVGQPKKIGYKRVDNYILNSIAYGASVQVQANSPLMWGFAHSTNPEIWWQFRAEDGSGNKAIVYNYLDDTWFLVSPFNIGALTGAQLAIPQVVVGIYGGDLSNNIIALDSGSTQFGVTLTGVIETGDLAGRYKNSRLSRANFGVIPSPLGLNVQTQIADFTNPGDAVNYAAAVTLDDDSRQDEFHTNKLFSLKLQTPSNISVTDFSLWMQPAGERS